MEEDALLNAIAIPVLIAAVALFAARCLRGKCAWLAAPQLPATALTGVLFAAFAQQSSGLPWPPHISFDWFPWGIAIVWLATSLLALWRRVDQSPHGCFLAGVATAAAFAVIAPAGLHVGFRALGAAIAGICTFAQLRSRWIPEASAANAGASTQPNSPSISRTYVGATIATAIAMWGSLAALSLLVLASGFAKLAVILGATSAFSAALAVLAAVQRPLVLGTPTIALWCAIQAVAAMYAMGNDDGAVPTYAWLLAAAAPLAIAIVFAPPVSPKPRLVLCLRAILPPVVAVVALCIGRCSASPPSDATLDYAHAGNPTAAQAPR